MVSDEPTSAAAEQVERHHSAGPTPEAEYELDLSGHCTCCNQTCTQLLGFAGPTEIVGKNMHSLIHYRRADGTPYPEEESPIIRTLRTGERTHIEDDVFWRADGSGIRVEYWTHPTRREGRIDGAVVRFHAAKSHTERLGGPQPAATTDPVVQLAGRLADEFGNLLTIVYGYAQMVLGTVPPGDPAHEFVRQMVAGAGRADALSRKLAALSRTAVFRPEVVDMRTLVAKLEGSIRRTIGKEISLTTCVPSKPGTVHADPAQIEQVILNLVTNARDAMPQGGRLAVEIRNVNVDAAYVHRHPAARPGPYVVLAVIDTGCGIDQGTLARVYNEFATTKGKGAGLGLAIVDRIVKQSGGHVSIASEVGRGTTVEVYLPRV